MERKFTEQEQIRRAKLKKMQDRGDNPYLAQRSNKTYDLNEFNQEFEPYTKEQLHDNPSKLITLCGRLMNVRQTFAVIQDFSGKSQIYIDKKKVDENIWNNFSESDIGDIIEVSGHAMKTNTGMVTLNAISWKIISKALKVLPEKFHGLTDEELRSRHRYVDLIVNEESRNTFIIRSKLIRSIRNFLDNNGYYEVETPILCDVSGGAAAKPFITHFNALNKDFYMRVAPEISLKKCVVGGLEKVYEIGRVFRNEGMDSTHNPEFTSIEVYTAYIGMEETMDLTENIIKNTASVLNKFECKYRGFTIDLNKPFKRVHMVELIKEITGIDFFKITTDNDAIELAKKHNIELESHQKTYGHVVNAFFEKYGEQKCIEPTFVYGHPVDVSPLSKLDYDDPRFTKRFELFIGQKEFANAFSELNDPIDQYNRFEQQLKEKSLGNDEANDMDIDFIEALEYGLPPTGGLGIGIDRLTMLFTDQDSIRNVLLFPHMKNAN